MTAVTFSLMLIIDREDRISAALMRECRTSRLRFEGDDE
jgi:hypothetical protein